MTISMFTFQGEYRLVAELLVPERRDRVFEFFSEAKNLESITPDSIGFSIVTPEPITMNCDSVIDYKIKIRGIPLRWRTLISHWDPPYSFIDEQLRGPYRYWIHKHSFEEVDGGTLVRDLVRYQVLGGAFVHTCFVQNDLKTIFTYRQEVLAKKYGC